MILSLATASDVRASSTGLGIDLSQLNINFSVVCSSERCHYSSADVNKAECPSRNVCPSTINPSAYEKKERERFVASKRMVTFTISFPHNTRTASSSSS